MHPSVCRFTRKQRRTRISGSMKNCHWAVVICLLLLAPSFSPAQRQTPEGDPSEKLAADFWAWRAQYAPFSGDDVNRMERPGGLRDWSRAKIEDRLKALTEFETRWKQVDTTAWAVPRQVDYRLIGSGLARVRWELEVNPRWKRDPNFYIEQTLTPVVEALTVPGPYDAAHSAEILARIQNILAILQQAAENLDQPPAPFASVAIEALRDIRPRLREMATTLRPATTLDGQQLSGASERAADALEEFRQQLEGKLRWAGRPTCSSCGMSR